MNIGDVSKSVCRIILLHLIVGLAACSSGGDGGGGGDGGDPDLDKPISENGVFLDSAVAGVAYRSGSLSGFTGAGGEYEYETGEPVVFSIGDLVLGTVSQGKGVLTPLDFGSLQLGINVASLLQSMDQDGDPSNGIVITAAMRTALTGTGTVIDFEQTAANFANDTAVQAVLDIIAPHTLAGMITLPTAQQAIEHLSTELHLDILEVDVAGAYEVRPAASPNSPAVFVFNADKSGTRTTASTVNTTWAIDTANRLMITDSTSMGLPARMTLISGTLDDGILAAEVDVDENGSYEVFSLVSMIRLPDGPGSGGPGGTITPGVLCGVSFNTQVSADISAHSLAFPTDSNWNMEPYTTSTASAEYNTFTTEVYADIPSTRVDVVETGTGAVLHSEWMAIAIDGAVYQLNRQVNGTDYPCSSPNMRFPATIAAGVTWPIYNQGFEGDATIVSTTAESPAGYTNTVKISMTFDLGINGIVSFDNYFRTGEGLLDWSDNMSQWLKRTDIAPENPPLPPPGFGTLTLSAATIPTDNGSYLIDSAISSGTVSYTWVGEPGVGITLVVTNSLGTTSMQVPSGNTYACTCLPVVNNTEMTATFTNMVLTDTFPNAPGPSTNSITLNGVLDLPTESF